MVGAFKRTLNSTAAISGTNTTAEFSRNDTTSVSEVRSAYISSTMSAASSTPRPAPRAIAARSAARRRLRNSTAKITKAQVKRKNIKSKGPTSPSSVFENTYAILRAAMTATMSSEACKWVMGFLSRGRAKTACPPVNMPFTNVTAEDL